MPPRRFAPRPLADFIGTAIAQSCAKRGLASVEIVTHWPDIVGEPLAARAAPLKLIWPARGDTEGTGVLHVRVEGAYAIDLQHEAPVVIERINRYFGWRCVGRLALRQGPVAGLRQKPAPPPEPDAAALAGVARRIGQFEDAALGEALARLGALVARGHAPRRS
ncbi:MAG TPA: DciA family protein [Xanthobacteraceae bacterium]|nr:DciA family protein [Xanthobacteraceae bacterium]